MSNRQVHVFRSELNARLNTVNSDRAYRMVLDQLKSMNALDVSSIPQTPPIKMKRNTWKVIRSFAMILSIIIASLSLWSKAHMFYSESVRINFIMNSSTLVKKMLKICQWMSSFAPHLKGTISGILASYGSTRLKRIITDPSHLLTTDFLKLKSGNVLIMGKSLATGIVGDITGTSGMMINKSLSILDQFNNKSKVQQVFTALNVASGRRLTTQMDEVVNSVLWEGTSTLATMLVISSLELGIELQGADKIKLMMNKLFVRNRTVTSRKVSLDKRRRALRTQ